MFVCSFVFCLVVCFVLFWEGEVVGVFSEILFSIYLFVLNCNLILGGKMHLCLHLIFCVDPMLMQWQKMFTWHMNLFLSYVCSNSTKLESSRKAHWEPFNQILLLFMWKIQIGLESALFLSSVGPRWIVCLCGWYAIKIRPTFLFFTPVVYVKWIPDLFHSKTHKFFSREWYLG